MRIVIVGQGPFGEKVLQRLIERGEEVVGVFSPPDKRGEPLKLLAERSGIEVFQPKQMKGPQVYEDFVRLRPDLTILAFVTDIIPERILEAAKLGTICYHPSILPRHRGASAINWAIIQGDTKTGLTIFWVDKGIDTGPILLQKEVEIKPTDTTGSLYFNSLFPLGVEAIIESVDLIKGGKAPRVVQDESQATYEPPCDDRVAAVDFTRPLEEIYNLIRGCDPQPGAYTTWMGRRIRLYEARAESLPSAEGRGEVRAIRNEGLEIAVPGGIITVGKLRVDKGEKVGPLEFAGLVGIKVGDSLG